MAARTDAYVDTSAFIAFMDASDTYHAIFRRLFADPPGVVVTSSLVVAEGHGWFLRRFDRVRALQFLAMIDDMPFVAVRPVGSAPRVDGRAAGDPRGVTVRVAASPGATNEVLGCLLDESDPPLRVKVLSDLLDCSADDAGVRAFRPPRSRASGLTRARMPRNPWRQHVVLELTRNVLDRRPSQLGDAVLTVARWWLTTESLGLEAKRLVVRDEVGGTTRRRRCRATGQH